MTKEKAIEALERLQDACSEFLNKKDADGAVEKETVRAILAGVRYAQEHLNTVESAAVLPERWEAIVSSIDRSVKYIQGSGPGHYYSYDTNDTGLDDFMLRIQALPTRTKGALQRIGGDLLEQIRRESDAAIDALGQTQEQHEHELKALQDRFMVVAERLDVRAQAAEQFRKETEAAEERRAKAFDQQLSRFQKSFGTFETQARERLDTEVAKQREAFDQAVAAFDEDHQRITDDASTSTATILTELQRHLARAEEIVGVVSKTALAGSYSEVAERERKDANVWRWISVAAMIGIIACAVFALVHSLSAGFSTNAFAAKIVTSFAFMILAAYAGRESGRHRRSAQHARRMQLELATIDSYLLTLPEEQRHAIKAAVADRIFGQPIEGEKSSSEADGSAPPLLDYLRLVLTGGDKT